MIQPRVASYNGFAKFLSLDLVAFLLHIKEWIRFKPILKRCLFNIESIILNLVPM